MNGEFNIDAIEPNELEVLGYKDIGQTENEDWGVDAIYAKQEDGSWTYINVSFRNHTRSVQWALKDGVYYEPK